MPSAGEVEQFAYCAHNWYLARHGATGAGAGSERGIARHAELGRAQAAIEGKKEEYRSGLAWSLRMLLVVGSISFLGFELVALRASPLHILFLTIALSLTSFSAGLMAIGLHAQREYRSEQRRAGIVPGKLAGSDLAGAGELMVDPQWGLSGKPDYWIRTEHGPVPVELKTGRTPPAPFPSHALQVACYLRLLEVTTGTRPEYGLVNYPGGVFRIPWDDAARHDLQHLLSRMAEAERVGRADRDHEQPGRCRGCSRREACDQRLA